MTGAEERACLQCGTAFTWTPAAPRQKFCSTRCKHRWHGPRRKRRRGRRGQAPAVTTTQVATAAAAGTTTEVTTAAGTGTTTEVGTMTGTGMPSPPPAGRACGPVLSAGPACPHCRKPVALVAWLVPPAAATVREPPRHADGDTPHAVRDNP